ncbi:hypothetical protein BN2537_3369 [Streptomyces venezuelae]|nr:hypothetical protein BN2537_3369 [Streptomyces venezuelae]
MGLRLGRPADVLRPVPRRLRPQNHPGHRRDDVVVQRRANQQCALQSDGPLRGTQSGLCLGVVGASTPNGARVELQTCKRKHWPGAGPAADIGSGAHTCRALAPTVAAVGASAGRAASGSPGCFRTPDAKVEGAKQYSLPCHFVPGAVHA